jgi:hypothetical protein
MANLTQQKRRTFVPLLVTGVPHDARPSTEGEEHRTAASKTLAVYAGIGNAIASRFIRC